MPRFSDKSIERLSTCRPALQTLFREVIRHVDCGIIEGHRGEEAQTRAYNEGKSKLPWPKGPHNTLPSNAVDVALWPLCWPNPKSKTYLKDLARWYWFGGFVQAVAADLGIPLVWGGDWNNNHIFIDQNFDDLPHFEIKGGKG